MKKIQTRPHAIGFPLRLVCAGGPGAVAVAIGMAALSLLEARAAQATATNALAGTADRWPAITLPPPGDVELGGPVGEALRRGVARWTSGTSAAASTGRWACTFSRPISPPAATAACS